MDAVEGQLEAYNARDAERFAQFFTHDVVLEDAAGARLMTGRDALRARYGEMFAATPALRCEVLSRMRAGRFVVDEERVTGRGPEPLYVIVVYTLRDDLIAHVRVLR
jgi:uncharacterized protein (TIGR02246 family)